MKKLTMILILTLLFCYTNYGVAQTTIWSEDFTYPNGTTQGSGNPPKWTINNPPSPDRWEVRSNQMEAKEIDSEGIWTSESINLSTNSDITVTVDLSEEGKMDNDDYIGVYYILDGGIETEFETNGYLIDDFNSATASQTGLNGNSLVIVIRLLNDDKKETHFFSPQTCT